jgi:AhpD family alkylhydroperoxidase
MAAFVAKTNGCEWCTKAHAATAVGAYRDGAKVSAVLADLETADIKEPLRATLRMLRKLTHEQTVDANGMRAVLAAGVSREQVEDALAVCFSFNTIGRLADAFGFPWRLPRPSRLARSTYSHAAIGDPNLFTGVRHQPNSLSPFGALCASPSMWHLPGPEQGLRCPF